MNLDPLGDALRKYYALFGVKDEGPPPNLNVSALLGQSEIEAERKLIDKICGDDIVVRKHNECKGLIEKLANSLGDTKFMLEVSESVPSIGDVDQEHMTNGIFWYYLASSLDPKMEEKLEFSLPFPEGLSYMQSRLIKTQGSLIFRLYISLLYMRHGPLFKLLKETARNKGPISQIALRLMRCDYVRHVRNSIAHSTFKSTDFGVLFQDEDKFEVAATPGFLNELATWIFLIYFQCSIAIDKKFK